MEYLGSEWTSFKKISILSRNSFSHNFGMYGDTFLPALNLFSFLLSAFVPISQWQDLSVKSSIALDQGQLFPTSPGGFISLKKHGNIYRLSK